MAWDTCAKVGFIGLGDIGMPMALNLIKAGLQTVVHDIREDANEVAVLAGGERAESVKALAELCEFVCLCVVDQHQTSALVEGPDGIFDNAKPGTVILCHSTMPPRAAVTFAAAAKAKGFEWLDAPMSGATIAAHDGTLTFIIGGEQRLIDRCRPILDAMGSNIFRLGGAGAGQVGKLVNGVMMHLGYIVAMEAMGLSSAYGIDEEKVVELAKVSTGNSWVIQHWGHFDAMIENHTLGADKFINWHIKKDIRDALTAAIEVRKSMPLTALAMQLYSEFLNGRLSPETAKHPFARGASIN